MKNEGNPVSRARNYLKFYTVVLKEMQANSIKEKVKPVVYFYNKNGKEIVDLSSKTPRLKDGSELHKFFRNEMCAGEVVYTVQEFEQIRDMISRMNDSTVKGRYYGTLCYVAFCMSLFVYI